MLLKEAASLGLCGPYCRPLPQCAAENVAVKRLMTSRFADTALQQSPLQLPLLSRRSLSCKYSVPRARAASKSAC